MMCFLGIFGIILMIINNEIAFTMSNSQDSIINWLIKLIISISTIILIGLIFYYHKLDLNLYCIKNSVEHLRIGLTTRRIFIITIEILICVIHPVPRDFHSLKVINFISTKSLTLSYISIDVALGLPSKYKIHSYL